MRLKFLSFSNLTLLVALSLSTVAAWYSIIGLTAIFAGAVVPIIIMGSILEVGKITTTVWLRKYWHRTGIVLKLYLVPAVIALAVLTSMGIFGFLSKAHMDQGIVSGDAIAKVQLYDEKITIQKDIVKSSKAMLAQMDQQVNDIMTKGDSERSVERSVAIRKQQAKERASLQKDIESANKEIQSLNELRAPLAAETRKIEAEVGPIKYIAALIYGDNPDQNVLERAVRWVIILLVVVFDPLAIALVLAANASKEWDANDDVEEENKLREKVEHEKVMAELEEEPVIVPVVVEEDLTDINHELAEAAVVTETIIEEPKVEEPVVEKSILEQHPYLNKPFTHFVGLKPMTSSIKEYEEPAIEPAPMPEPTVDSNILAIGVDEVERPGDYLTVDNSMPVTPDLPYKVDATGYVNFDGKHMSMDAFKGMRPDLFMLQADGAKQVNSGFGTKFPEEPNKGDVFVRVDVLPNKVFKYDGRNWIQTNKETSNTYLYNTKYIEYLVDSIGKGEYDTELLSENERSQIEDYLKLQKNQQNG